MAQAVLFAVFSLIAVAMSIPAVEENRLTQIPDGPPVDPSLGFQEGEYQVVVDLDALHETASQIKYALDDLFALLDEAAQNVSSVTPHAIQKRQVDVFGNADIEHHRYGVGFDHKGKWNYGGSFSHIPGANEGRFNFGRSWNNGRTRLGGSFGFGSGGRSAGISFSHRFGR